MRIVLFLGFLCLLNVLGSCSQEIEENNTSKDVLVDKVYFTVPEEEGIDVDTRALLTHNNTKNTISFTWQNGDVIGVCPASGNGDQLSFEVDLQESSEDEEPTLEFDGGGWKTKPGSYFTAYYPFNRDVFLGDLSAVPLSYLGQMQSSNWSTTHLGAYDFLSSDPMTSETTEFSFKMKRINIILNLQMTLPSDLPADDKFTQLRILSEDQPFTVEGTFNARTGDITVTETKSSKEVVLALDNVEVDGSNCLSLYFMLCPKNFKDKTWKVSLLSNIKDGFFNEYSMPISGVDFTDPTVKRLARFKRPRANNSADVYTVKKRPASEYPTVPQDNSGITGSAPDFIPVGGSTNQPD